MKKEEEKDKLEKTQENLLEKDKESGSSIGKEKPEEPVEEIKIEFEEKKLKVETEKAGKYNENEFVDDTAELAEWLRDIEEEHAEFESELTVENKKHLEEAEDDSERKAAEAWYREKEEELKKKYEESKKRINSLLNKIGTAFEDYAEEALEITPEKMELVDEKLKSEIERLELGTLNIERIGDELYTGDRFKEDWEKIQTNNRAIYDILGELNNYLTKELLKKWEESGQYTSEIDEWERNNRNFLQARANDLVRTSEERIIEMIKKSKRYIEAVFLSEMNATEGAVTRHRISLKDGGKIELMADTLPANEYDEDAYHKDREILNRLYREKGVTEEYIKYMEEIGKKHLFYARKFLGE